MAWWALRFWWNARINRFLLHNPTKSVILMNEFQEQGVQSMKLSVVIPCYNEEANVAPLYEACMAAL